MSVTLYDVDNWLVTSSRTLREFIAAAFDPGHVTVELNFPNTQELLPLPKTLIHLEMDAMTHPVVGFGVPKIEVIDDVNGTVTNSDLAAHEVNYDVGVWASRESGGATARMQAMQTLSNLFAPAKARLDFRDATGMSVVSFTGGRNELDRLDDVPVWRALDMTLVVRVVSRNVQTEVDILPTDIIEQPQLTITDDTGQQTPVT